MKVTCINSLLPLLSSSLPSSGVPHLTVPSDAEGVMEILNWLVFVPHVQGGPLPVMIPLDPVDRPVESPMTLGGCWLGRKTVVGVVQYDRNVRSWVNVKLLMQFLLSGCSFLNTCQILAG